MRCFIGIGSVVVGVEIPDGKFVPHGCIIDSAAKVKDLPDVTEAHMHFNEDVVEVNRGLAAAYHHTRNTGNGKAAPTSGRVNIQRRSREVGWDAPQSSTQDRF